MWKLHFCALSTVNLPDKWCVPSMVAHYTIKHSRSKVATEAQWVLSEFRRREPDSLDLFQGPLSKDNSEINSEKYQRRERYRTGTAAEANAIQWFVLGTNSSPVSQKDKSVGTKGKSEGKRGVRKPDTVQGNPGQQNPKGSMNRFWNTQQAHSLAGSQVSRLQWCGRNQRAR